MAASSSSCHSPRGVFKQLVCSKILNYLLVRECVKENILVETLPGATAFVPALVNSGFPCNEFVFMGFLPQKKGRFTKWQQLKNEERTFILYESPYRLIKVLEEIKENLGEQRRVSVSRELSKMFEENKRGTVVEVLEHFKKKTIKGEIVVVVEGKSENNQEDVEEEA